MTGKAQTSARFGRRKVTGMIRDIDDLRRAIRSHDSEGAEEAWERVEPHIDYAYRSDPAPALSWLDISVAPKDETRIVATNEEVVFCVWWAGDWLGWADDGGQSQPYNFTHWMPLAELTAVLIPDTEVEA